VSEKAGWVFVLENSDYLSICSNAEIPRGSETDDGPSEVCVRE
jgi:hypothetical protein